MDDTRAALLALKATLRREQVFIAALDRWVWIRELSGTERDAWETSFIALGSRGKQKRNLANVRARLLVLTIVDDTGERIFGDGDVEALGAIGASILDPLFDVAQRLSGLTVGDVEELEKN